MKINSEDLLRKIETREWAINMADRLTGGDREFLNTLKIFKEWIREVEDAVRFNEALNSKWTLMSERAPEPGEYICWIQPNMAGGFFSLLRYDHGWNTNVSYNGNIDRSSEITDVYAWAPFDRPENLGGSDENR